MEQNLTTVSSNEISGVITHSNSAYLQVLNTLGLPIEGILSPIDERTIAIANFPHVANKINENARHESHYLSKFFIAIADGLFDAALNYLWDETIKQLRIRITNCDLAYFYDVVISDNRRNQFSDEDDLTKLDDYDLVKGAFDIDLITQLGYKHLDYIRYMRNWASAAHPNNTELTGLNLINWLEICIREVIATPLSTILISVNRLLYNVKNEVIDDEQASTMETFFTELSNDKADALAKGFFGIYIDAGTTQQTRSNINKLVPTLWEVVSEEVKTDFGLRCATFIANGENNARDEAQRFLEIVRGQSYLPDSVKAPQIRQAIDNLRVAHNNLNNFYNEPSFARQLCNIVGAHGEIPSQLYYLYTKTVVSVFLTNGNGVCWVAEPIYKSMIQNFNPKQSLIAITSFTDDVIRNKLQFPLCQEKFSELLELTKPNITSQGVRELSVEISKAISRLAVLTEKDKMLEKVHFFQKNILR